MQEPSVGMLASAAGLAGVIWLIMQIIRTVVTVASFSRWGATIAAGVGVILAVAYAVSAATPEAPVTGLVLLQAVLVGLFGGWLSQSVNTMVTRAIAPKGS